MTMRYTGAALLLSIAVAGCQTSRAKIDAYRGNVPDIDRVDVAAYVDAQNRIASSLGSLDKEPAASGHRSIVNTGLMYVDTRCERYMDALFWFKRAQDGTSRQVGFVGAVSAAALEVLNASSNLIALAPLGFKLATDTIDNVGRGLLYDMSPSAVRAIVQKQQNAFKKAIEGQPYKSKSAALQVVQSYLAICLPASIETQIENAVKQVDFEEKKDPPVTTTTADVGTVAVVPGGQPPATGAIPPAPGAAAVVPGAAATPVIVPRVTTDKVPIIEMVGSRAPG